MAVTVRSTGELKQDKQKLLEQYPVAERVVELPPSLALEYEHARERAEYWHRRVLTAEVEMLEHMQGARTAVSGGRKIATRIVITKKSYVVEAHDEDFIRASTRTAGS
jgi:hypothetical protein